MRTPFAVPLLRDSDCRRSCLAETGKYNRGELSREFPHALRHSTREPLPQIGASDACCTHPADAARTFWLDFFVYYIIHGSDCHTCIRISFTNSLPNSPAPSPRTVGLDVAVEARHLRVRGRRCTTRWLRPVRIRFRTLRSPRSGDSGTSRCPGETHTSKTGVCSGRPPILPDYSFANEAYGHSVFRARVALAPSSFWPMGSGRKAPGSSPRKAHEPCIVNRVRQKTRPWPCPGCGRRSRPRGLRGAPGATESARGQSA